MTKDTKRVDELEVGDIVIFPGCKGIDTISRIKKIDDYAYEIFSKEFSSSKVYKGLLEVTYLGNNKKEETMTTQKVDCSALYPYFDSLANEELTLRYTNVPVYVKQQLKNIHELFEDILGLTLEEVKALYFERKTGKSKVESTKVVDSELITKKAKELCLGDRVILSPDKYGFIKNDEVVKIISLRSLVPQKIRFAWEDCYAIYDLEAEVKIMRE